MIYTGHASVVGEFVNEHSAHQKVYLLHPPLLGYQFLGISRLDGHSPVDGSERHETAVLGLREDARGVLCPDPGEPLFTFALPITHEDALTQFVVLTGDGGFPCC